MTSQIAIRNQTGVVIASDTVTTLTTDNTMQKSISDQQKIWTLEPNNLIAILTSGNANINGIRKSTLITEWKRNTNKIFSTVQECAEDFNAWLSAGNIPVTDDSEQKVVLDLIRSHVETLRTEIVAELKAAGLYFPDFDCADQMKIVIDNLINQSVEDLDVLPFYEQIRPSSCKKIIDNLFEEIDLIIEDVMWDCMPDSDSRKIIQKSLPLLLSTIQKIDDLDSTFGFVGFGSEEIFSEITRVSVRGYYCSSLQSICLNDDAYDFGSGGEIALFAQTDAIEAFTYGYHEDLLLHLTNLVKDKLSEYIDDEDKVFDIVLDLEDVAKSYGIENFAQPLLSTIGTLNLNDLANLADSLIGMQSVKSLASPRPATVGGLIEILLIDRENGFRWFRKLPSRTSVISVVD